MSPESRELFKADVARLRKIIGCTFTSESEAIHEAVKEWLAQRIKPDATVGVGLAIQGVLAAVVSVKISDYDITSEAGGGPVTQAVHEVSVAPDNILVRIAGYEEYLAAKEGGIVRWTDPVTLAAMEARPVEVYPGGVYDDPQLIRYFVTAEE